MPRRTAIPTCQQLLEEDGYKSVARTADDSWRHGSYVTQVFECAADGTFWSASYRLSTDGETDELREGLATISQVEPYSKTVTEYRPIPNEEAA